MIYLFDSDQIEPVVIPNGHNSINNHCSKELLLSTNKLRGKSGSSTFSQQTFLLLYTFPLNTNSEFFNLLNCLHRQTVVIRIKKKDPAIKKNCNCTNEKKTQTKVLAVR